MKIVKPAESEYNTKVAAMLAAGEQVDLVYLDWTTYDDLTRNNPGLFVALDDRIKSSSIFSDKTKFPDSRWDYLRKPDGHLYGTEPLGGGWMATGTLPIVRWDWVQKLGFADKFNNNPKVSLNDYYDLLSAFTFKDPDGNGKQDTYGISFGDTIYDAEPFFGSVGAVGYYAKDASGKVYVPYAQQSSKPAWEFLAKLYAQKILDPNFVTNGSSQFRQMFMTDKVGMISYWTNWVNRFTDTVKESNPNSAFHARAIYPPAGANGMAITRTGRPAFNAIPSASKYQDQAFKILEVMQTDKGAMLGVAGVEGYDYNIVNGKIQWTDVGIKSAQNHGHAPAWDWNPPWPISPDLTEAVKISLASVRPEDTFGRSSDQWDNIVDPVAAKMIRGEMSIDAGLAELRKTFKDQGLTDY